MGSKSHEICLKVSIGSSSNIVLKETRRHEAIDVREAAD